MKAWHEVNGLPFLIVNGLPFLIGDCDEVFCCIAGTADDGRKNRRKQQNSCALMSSKQELMIQVVANSHVSTLTFLSTRPPKTTVGQFML